VAMAKESSSAAAAAASTAKKAEVAAKHKTYKLVVFGSGAVGKSSVTLRFVSNTFTQDYLPTIEDCYRKTTSVDSAVVSLDILDTAGQEDFSALRDQWVREGNAFLLLYSVTSRQSFRDLVGFRERILLVNEERDITAPIVLVGNKIDLESERKVTTEEGKKLAAEWGGIPFVEVSALLGLNCEHAFHACVREIRREEAKARAASAGSSGGSSGSSSGGFWSFCTIL